MNKNILFGERLKAARIQRELRQKDIADAIGISVSTYSLYETGSRTPSIHKLTQIAQVLQVSADELLDLPSKHAVSDTLLPLSPSYQKILDSVSRYSPEDIDDLLWIFSSAHSIPPKVTIQLAKLYLSMELPFRLEIAELVLHHYKELNAACADDTDIIFLERSLHLVRSYAKLSQDSDHSFAKLENNS